MFDKRLISSTINSTGDRSFLGFGFTIVELLVVIVVIGILAAITVVSYTAVSQKATVSSLQSELTDVSRELSIFQVLNENYPTTIDCAQADSATNKCLKSDSVTIYDYTVNNINSARFYCITASKNSIMYRVGSDGAVTKGNCLDYGLVLHLDSGDRTSYPATGNTIFDLSGNNNGTLTNGVSYTASNHGFMNFDGINDYIAVSPIEFKTTQPWSYSLGMVIPSGLDGNWRTFISGGSSDIDSNWFFHGGTQLAFYQDYYNSSTWLWYTGLTIGTQIPKDTFFVMTITSEPVSLYKTNFKAYIDGVLKAQQVFTWSGRLTAPRQVISNIGGAVSRFFQGKIQDIRVYNRILGIDEAVTIYDTLNNRYGS